MPNPANIDSGTSLQLSGLSAGILNADLVPAQEVSQYKWISLFIGPDVYSGTLTFQGSFDGVSYWPLLMYNLSSLDGGLSTSSTTATNVFVGVPVLAPYFRVRMTSYTSGFATGMCLFCTDPPAGLQLLTTNARLLDSQGKIGYLNNGGKTNYAIAAGTATNTIISGAGGMLGSVLVTTTGTADLVIYDNPTTASGTIIGLVPANSVKGLYVFRTPAQIGITVAGNGNNPGVTIFY